MKKLLAVLLCLVMVVSLFAACNQNTPATTTKPATTTAAPAEKSGCGSSISLAIVAVAAVGAVAIARKKED